MINQKYLNRPEESVCRCLILSDEWDNLYFITYWNLNVQIPNSHEVCRGPSTSDQCDLVDARRNLIWGNDLCIEGNFLIYLKLEARYELSGVVVPLEILHPPCGVSKRCSEVPSRDLVSSVLENHRYCAVCTRFEGGCWICDGHRLEFARVRGLN